MPLTADTRAIWQQAAHTTNHHLLATRQQPYKKSLTLNEKKKLSRSSNWILMSCQPHSHLRTQVGRKKKRERKSILHLKLLFLTTHNALQFKLTWCQFSDGSPVLAGTEAELPTDTVAGAAPVTAHCRCCTGTWCLYDGPLASISACFWASPAVVSMHCGQMDKGTKKHLWDMQSICSWNKASVTN